MSEPSRELIRGQYDFDAQLEAVKRLVLDSLVSPNTKASYDIAITKFFKWYRGIWRGPFNKAAVHAYRTHLQDSGLGASTVNARLCAIKKLAEEAADNGLLDGYTAAAIARVKRVPNLGTRTGVWLNREQVLALLKLPNRTTLTGKRDYALLLTLLTSGLRRQEICDLTFEHVQEREGRPCIVDIIGKGGRRRTVPVLQWTRDAILEWGEAAGVNRGIIFLATYAGKRGQQRRIEGRPLTPQLIFQVVKRYGRRLGMEIGVHDLRRSYAKLAMKGGAALHQIQKSLGHSSLMTTERYLGVDQDLENAPCDHLGLVDTQPAEHLGTGDASAAARAMQKRATKSFMENTTPEERSANASKAAAALWEKLNPEERTEFAKAQSASKTPEQRSAAARKGADAKWLRMTLAARQEALKKASRVRWERSRTSPGEAAAPEKVSRARRNKPEGPMLSNVEE